MSRTLCLRDSEGKLVYRCVVDNDDSRQSINDKAYTLEYMAELVAKNGQLYISVEA